MSVGRGVVREARPARLPLGVVVALAPPGAAHLVEGVSVTGFQPTNLWRVLM